MQQLAQSWNRHPYLCDLSKKYDEIYENMLNITCSDKSWKWGFLVHSVPHTTFDKLSAVMRPTLLLVVLNNSVTLNQRKILTIYPYLHVALKSSGLE